MNAFKHGLTSTKVVLPGEDAAAFEHLRKSLMREHRPKTPTESLLVEEMAQAHWRLDRVRRRQDHAFESETLDAPLLTVLHRYATTYERSFFKALEALKKLQAQATRGFVSQKGAQPRIFRMADALAAPPPIDPSEQTRFDPLPMTAHPIAAGNRA